MNLAKDEEEADMDKMDEEEEESDTDEMDEEEAVVEVQNKEEIEKRKMDRRTRTDSVA